MNRLKALAITAATPPLVAFYALVAAGSVFWAVVRASMPRRSERPVTGGPGPLSRRSEMPWPDFDQDQEDFDPSSDPWLMWFDDPRVIDSCIPYLHRCLDLQPHDPSN